MNYFYAVFLGLIQGLTEFLPVSSSGHLALVENVFGLKVDLLFDVLLHFSTLTAVVAAFWKDILDMCKELGRIAAALIGRKSSEKATPTRRLVVLIIVGSLPLVLSLLLSFTGITEGAKANSTVVGLLLCATGLLLFLSDRLPKGEKTEKNAFMADALIVGACQGVAALLPGFSRSGVTIAGGLFRKFNRAFAVRFSFLLSVPAVLAATLWELIKVLRDHPAAEAAGAAAEAVSTSGFTLGHYIVGMLVAAAAGYLAIGLVRRLIGKGKFGAFAYYCLALGVIAVAASLIIR